MLIRMEKHIGKVVHWYGRNNVAVVDLDGHVAEGDHVVVRKGDSEFDDRVESIQIDHKDVHDADAGENAAIKLSHKAKEGSDIYLAS